MAAHQCLAIFVRGGIGKGLMAFRSFTPAYTLPVQDLQARSTTKIPWKYRTTSLNFHSHNVCSSEECDRMNVKMCVSGQGGMKRKKEMKDWNFQ